jgi:hypothetical protein
MRRIFKAKEIKPKMVLFEAPERIERNPYGNYEE